MDLRWRLWWCCIIGIIAAVCRRRGPKALTRYYLACGWGRKKRGRGRRELWRSRCYAVDSDVVCKRTLIIDCSWKIVSYSPLAINEESDVVSSWS